MRGERLPPEVRQPQLPVVRDRSGAAPSADQNEPVAKRIVGERRERAARGAGPLRREFLPMHVPGQIEGPQIIEVVTPVVAAEHQHPIAQRVVGRGVAAASGRRFSPRRGTGPRQGAGEGQNPCVVEVVVGVGPAAEENRPIPQRIVDAHGLVARWRAVARNLERLPVRRILQRERPGIRQVAAGVLPPEDHRAIASRVVDPRMSEASGCQAAAAETRPGRCRAGREGIDIDRVVASLRPPESKEAIACRIVNDIQAGTWDSCVS